MASWFTQSTGIDLTSALDALSETVQGVTETVQDAIPKEHKEMLAKLTLNTDEMISVRENFRKEAFRKEDAKDRLNKILPWETLDPEREILVEECKDAILELSGREENFFGPYEMPLLNVQLEVSVSQDEDEESSEPQTGEPEDGSVEDGPEEVPDEDTEIASENKARHMPPTEESLEMLAKLKPLPPLLENFDLEEHVGLIQNVMGEDPKLVAMQACFSGGGDRERTFWRNYFFHCAFTRYKAGLSLDEIWSYPEEATSDAADQSQAEGASIETPLGAAGPDATVPEGEEAVADTTATNEATTTPSDDDVPPAEGSAIDFDGADGARTIESTSLAELSELSPKNGFELIDEDLVGGGDPELDELEAEIARELEGF